MKYFPFFLSALLIPSFVGAVSLSLPRGSQGMPVASMTLQASCQADATLQAITIRHRGVGRVSDILRVYALRGGKRVSNTATLERENQAAVLTFRNERIRKCASETYTIEVDIASDADASGQHQFYVKPDDIEAEGSLSVKADATSAPVLTIAPTTAAQVDIEYLPLHGSVTYGAGRSVARFRLTVSGSKDQDLRAITLTNDGSATDTDLQNLVLRSGNKQLASSASLDGDRVRFLLSKPLLLEKGNTYVFEVLADIRASRRRTIQLSIDEPSDIEAADHRGR